MKLLVAATLAASMVLPLSSFVSLKMQKLFKQNNRSTLKLNQQQYGRK
jgi:fructose-specific phosphotransferase system IIC component